MWFAFVCEDIPASSALRAAHLPAHLARLEALDIEGRLLLAGPFPIEGHDPEAGCTGSLIVADFDDIDTARRWSDNEPFVAAGIYRSVVVKPFRKMLPAN